MQLKYFKQILKHFVIKACLNKQALWKHIV